MKGRQSFTDAVCLELENWGTRATLTDSVKMKILGQYMKIISVYKSCINYDCNFSDCFFEVGFRITLPWLVPFFQAFFFLLVLGIEPTALGVGCRHFSTMLYPPHLSRTF